MNNRKLQRRAGTETHKTYWLDLAGDGFAKVHTSAEDNPRQVCPERRHLAAMVERAPEMAELLRKAAAHVRPTCSELHGEIAELLAEIDAAKPGAPV